MPDAPQSEIRNPQQEHTTVLLQETVDLIAPKAGGVYVDGTLGGGGHAEEVLKRSQPDGILVGLDQDEEAVSRSRVRLAPYGERAIIRQSNFRDCGAVLEELGIRTVDGILLDLGLSWFHVRSPERGFSFMSDGPLDMRMDRNGTTTAADLVNTLSHHELARIIREFGEEPKANAIARAIDQERARGPIISTGQLAQIISRVFPPYPPRRTHPATLTFQALRIAVNDELGALRDVLDRMVPLLASGGRIAVISFHSLEDRIVKQSFVAHARGCICPPKLPLCQCGNTPSMKILTKRPITAGEGEVRNNPASRSAKLRAAERL